MRKGRLITVIAAPSIASEDHGPGCSLAIRTHILLAVALLGAILATASGTVAKQAEAQNPGLLKRPIEVLTPTDGVDLEPYNNSIARKVSPKWRAAIPAEARSGGKGKTVVRFRILKNGNTKKLSIAVSSGSDALDKAAIQAVRDASPMDPLPPAFKGRYIDLRMTFLYNLPLEYENP